MEAIEWSNIGAPIHSSVFPAYVKLITIKADIKVYQKQ